ncbi:MAG: ATP-binding protein [Granulosicoccus sp.]
MIGQVRDSGTTEVKEFLTSLIGNAPVGILALDIEGRCILSNSWAAGVFGASAEQIVDCHFSQLLDSWHELKASLSANQVDGRLDFDLQSILRRERVYDVSGRVIVNGLLITLHDITEETRIREEQVQLVNRLEHANRELAEFAYICAHDMKSPVSNLMGLIGHMENCDDLDGEAKTLFEMFKQSTAGLDRKIRSLNEMLALKQTLGEDEGGDSNLKTVLDEVIASMQPELTTSSAQINVDNFQDGNLPVSESHLQSIFYNLIGNAVKYRQADQCPNITIRTRQTDSRTVIEISDNGMGFDLALGQHKAFGLFNRLHTHVEGTGVGLYLVKSIIESYGGCVSVDSVEHVGSTFRLEFPNAA